jgi:hypothetical protein
VAGWAGRNGQWISHSDTKRDSIMTVVLPQLPAPGGSPQEVLFRRMLLQCTQRVQQPAHTEGGKDWRTDAKFHCVSLQQHCTPLYTS